MNRGQQSAGGDLGVEGQLTTLVLSEEPSRLGAGRCKEVNHNRDEYGDDAFELQREGTSAFIQSRKPSCIERTYKEDVAPRTSDSLQRTDRDKSTGEQAAEPTREGSGRNHDSDAQDEFGPRVEARQDETHDGENTSFRDACR